MLKQQTVTTSLGQLTVSSLTLGELRQLDSLFAASAANTGFTSLFKYVPVVYIAIRKAHQQLSVDQLESGLTLDDFNQLFVAMLEVSGLTKANPGEAAPVTV